MVHPMHQRTLRPENDEYQNKTKEKLLNSANPSDALCVFLGRIVQVFQSTHGKVRRHLWNMWNTFLVGRTKI